MSKQIKMFKSSGDMDEFEERINKFMKSIPENDIYDVSSSTDHYSILVTIVYREQ